MQNTAALSSLSLSHNTVPSLLVRQIQVLLVVHAKFAALISTHKYKVVLDALEIATIASLSDQVVQGFLLRCPALLRSHIGQEGSPVDVFTSLGACKLDLNSMLANLPIQRVLDLFKI